jgi:hypothetical protein
MSDHRSPPPDLTACLVRMRSSTQKGGTLIAEDVADLETHRRRVCDPGGYRPTGCPTCGHCVLHAHGYRPRLLVADASGTAATFGAPDAVTTPIAVYLCVGCGATWRILPMFVARHLWRSWPTVETCTVAGPPARSQPRVPDRTVRRWRQRLASSARRLVQLLATSGSALLEAVAKAVGLDATRAELAAAYVHEVVAAARMPLGDLASLVHRLEPGARLM